MTGINPLSLPLRLWGDGDDDSAAPQTSVPHFIRTPDPAKGEVFTGGGLIPASGIMSSQIRKDLYMMMVRLMLRMKADTGRTDLWQDKLAGRLDAAGMDKNWRAIDNPAMPSGYTYLLQFIAHDMVDTVVLMEAGNDGTASASLRNARMRPLMLDTLYGNGPDECPHAYVFREGGVHDRDAPRTRLRMADGFTDPPSGCPARDFMRLAPDEDPASSLLTDALIADPRNDFHPIIAQASLLFAMLHNWIMEAIETVDGNTPIEMTWRQFLCARTITTMIYRAIVEHDVLPRILHPAVHAQYVQARAPLLDRNAASTLEFAAGAFRFGHAMVQNEYFVNALSANAPLPFENAMNFSSRGGGSPDRNWAIDWRRFFRLDEATVPNLSHRIGPVMPKALLSGAQFESILRGTPLDGVNFDTGLALRDFLASAYTGLWSVESLTTEIKRRLAPERAGLAAQIPAFEVWRQPLRDWLAVGNEDVAGTPVHLSDAELEALSRDPPLSFFVLFEAAHEIADGAPRLAAAPGEAFPGQGGGTLGPVGSMIVAEPFYAALSRGPRCDVDAENWLRDAVGKVCAGLGIVPAPLAQLSTHGDGRPRNIATMSQLVAFLDETGFEMNLGRKLPAIS